MSDKEKRTPIGWATFDKVTNKPYGYEAPAFLGIALFGDIVWGDQKPDWPEDDDWYWKPLYE
jgi:hypothetical protein